MASYSDIASRWTEIVTGKTDKSPIGGRSRMFVDMPNDRWTRRGDSSALAIFSYGHHFELARFVRPRGGSSFFILNGDTYSVTTNRHQNEIRAAVNGTDFPYVIIPHTAAFAAGIDLDSVRVIDSHGDGSEEIRHTLKMADGDYASMLAEATDKTRAAVSELRAKLAADDNGYGYSYGTASGSAERKAPDGSRVTVTIYGAGYEYGNGVDVTSGWRIREESDWRPSFYRNGGGLEHVSGDTFRYSTYRHWLGASVFSASVCETVETWTTDASKTDPDSNGYRTGAHGLAVKSYRLAVDNVKRRAKFVSSFDDNERRPLYFLAELPRDARPSTVSEAIGALCPSEVLAAFVSGRDVKRQGDIFAVPCNDDDSPPRIAARYADKRAVIALDGTSSHVASELTTANGRTYARGVITHTGGDHARLRLGKQWHTLYRNTVPLVPTVKRPDVIDADNPWTWTERTAASPQARRGNSWRPIPGRPRAFTIRGRVD